MAPTSPNPDALTHLFKRYYYGGYYGSCDSDSVNYAGGWYCYGRWILTGVIIFVALVVFFLACCAQSRRRRKHGSKPVYGTGWMAPNHGPVNYYGGAPHQQDPPPQYPNNTGNSNMGYYGNQTSYGGGYGQQNGVELQQPQNVYAPPSGPPPNKY